MHCIIRSLYFFEGHCEMVTVLLFPLAKILKCINDLEFMHFLGLYTCHCTCCFVSHQLVNIFFSCVEIYWLFSSLLNSSTGHISGHIIDRNKTKKIILRYAEIHLPVPHGLPPPRAFSSDVFR